MMKVRFIESGDILEGSPKEIVEDFSPRAKGNIDEYMKEFQDRFKVGFGMALFYRDAESFLRALDGKVIDILEA